jgi:hypothetical protein
LLYTETALSKSLSKELTTQILSLFVRLRFSGGGGETHSSGQEGLALALQVKG